MTNTTTKPSRAKELMGIVNQHLKNESLTSAASETYKSGKYSTGILPMDALLNGGIGKGRFALLAGESATLKSMVGLSTAAQVQKQGGVAALVDAEHAFDQDWAAKSGVDLSELILSRPETGEQAVDQMEILIREGIDYICVDSIAALLPKAERDLMLSGKDNLQPARIAALMSPALRKLTACNEKTTVVWISQMRDNIGAMAFAPKTNITGGKAIHFYVSQSIMLKKIGKITTDVSYFNGEKDMSDKQIVAQQFRAELGKSRTSQPFQLQHFNFDLINGEVDNLGYLIAQGLNLGIITKNGASWTYSEVDEETGVVTEHKGRGKDNFKEMLANNTDLTLKLLNNVCASYSLNPDNYV